MHSTTVLPTVNHWKFLETYGDSTVTHCSYVRVSLQLEKQPLIGPIHQSLQYGLNVHLSLLRSLQCLSLAIAFELLLLPLQGMVRHSAPLFFISYTGINVESIYLPLFLVASIVFCFCIIGNAEFQSQCLLTPFKGFILALKPYIILYMFF